MTNELTKYKTIATKAVGDYRDRGSKFLAYAYPIQTVVDVRGLINTLKKEHPKAVHHCYAYRVGIDGTEYRANDDGEPAGSAGKPILGQIDSMGFTNVLVVVVRYFGGTLLGIPGLINAYKSATATALQSVPVIEKWIEELYEINFDYPAIGEVLYLLKQSDATIYEQNMQLFCVVKVGIPIPNTQLCTKRLSEIKGVTISLSN